jgi:putative PIN family toxin of toxin-antitoxin system
VRDSDFILNALTRKLKEKFGFREDEIAEIRVSTATAAEVVQPAEVAPGSCRDPGDLPVLGTAVAGRVEVLITVDKDLLDLKAHRGIAIIRPGEFWSWTESLRPPR